MIRDAELTEFTGEAIKAMIEAAQDVPMLDMFGGEDWTPDTDHPGLFQRAGMNHWATYEWDPDAEGEFDGNFVEVAEHQLRRGPLRVDLRRPGGDLLIE